MNVRIVILTEDPNRPRPSLLGPHQTSIDLDNLSPRQAHDLRNQMTRAILQFEESLRPSCRSPVG